MIHINFEQFIKDHVWFGWFWREAGGSCAYDSNGKLQPLPDCWDYAGLWRFRIWPCMKMDQNLPDWWVNLACKFSKDGR